MILVPLGLEILSACVPRRARSAPRTGWPVISPVLQIQSVLFSVQYVTEYKKYFSPEFLLRNREISLIYLCFML